MGVHFGIKGVLYTRQYPIEENNIRTADQIGGCSGYCYTGTSFKNQHDYALAHGFTVRNTSDYELCTFTDELCTNLIFNLLARVRAILKESPDWST